MDMIAVMKRPPSQILTPLRAVTTIGPAVQILAGVDTRRAAARETDTWQDDKGRELLCLMVQNLWLGNPCNLFHLFLLQEVSLRWLTTVSITYTLIDQY